MQPRTPRPSLHQTVGPNLPLIAVAWILVAVKIIGRGFLGFSLSATGLFEVGYTVLGVVLIRSTNRANKINGWIFVCYELFQMLIGVGHGLSHFG